MIDVPSQMQLQFIHVLIKKVSTQKFALIWNSTSAVLICFELSVVLLSCFVLSCLNTRSNGLLLRAMFCFYK
jgi:hypothetical protein